MKPLTTNLGRSLLAGALAAIAALGVAAGPLAAVAHADVSDLYLQWPAVQAFNPDRTAYTITVDDPDGGTLMAVWGDDAPQPVAHHGQTTLSFDSSAYQRSVQLERCDDSGADCVVVATSPTLTVLRRLGEGFRAPDLTRTGPGRPVVDQWLVVPAASTDHVDYTIRTGPAIEDENRHVRLGTGDPIATGSLDVSPDGRTPVDLAFPLPAGLPSGVEYHIDADVSSRSDVFGDLEGSFVPTQFYIDDSFDIRITAPTSAVLYPEQDGYLDEVRIGTQDATDDYVLSGDLLTADGADLGRVFSRPLGAFYVGSTPWRGSLGDGPVAPGRYTLRVTATDPVGNQVVRDVAVSVFTGRLVSEVRTTSVRPSAAVTRATAGRCGAVGADRRGRVRLIRYPHCPAPTSVTLHVPMAPSFDGRWSRAHLSFSTARVPNAPLKPYTFTFMKRTGKSGRSIVFDGPYTSGGPAIPPASVVDPTSSKPYVVVVVTIGAGSALDLTGIATVATRHVLVGG